MTDTDNTPQSSRQDWLDFLQQQGAIISNGIVTGFSAQKNSVSPDTAMLCDLSSRGVIKACGEEAQSFLQNQFCNDVRNVNETTSQLNGYCTPKGRLLAVFRLWQYNDCYYLGLPQERLPVTLKRLQMFVLMSKVTLSNASDDIVTIGLSGSGAESILNEYVISTGHTLPTTTDQGLSVNDTTIMRVPGNTPRFEICAPPSTIQLLWQKLAPHSHCASESAWQLLDIQSGIPQIVDSTSEAFVPQMVNMELINALSFKKGCYPGQEIVARTHYLGKQKRRMYLCHLDSAIPPAAGSTIVASNDSSGQAAGTVVSAASSTAGGVDLLAVLQIAKAKTGELLIAGDQMLPVTLKELPYSIEEEESAK